jgi:hypothetical protein
MTLQYELKRPVERHSPTVIELAHRCERLYGYQARFKTPEPAQPSRLVHGTLTHAIGERIWEDEFKELGKVLNFARPYFTDVFNGVYGPKGAGTGPISIAWHTPREAERRTKEDLERLVTERKRQLVGSGMLGVEAIWRDYALRRPHVKEVWVEHNLREHDVTVRSPSGRLFLLGGKIDRVEFYPDDTYTIFDIKTGRTVHYLDRETLIDSDQPTVYNEGMRQIMNGQEPQAIYLQAMPLSRAELDEHGDETLFKLQRLVEPRTETHLEELTLFIDDVTAVVDMVENPENHAAEERANWRPISPWGRKADLVRNIREGRLIPRIGAWCNTCKYLEICRVDNADDWAAERERLTGERTETPPRPIVKIKKSDAQYEIPGIERGRRLPVRYKKRDVEKKRELLATGMYYPQHRFLARIKKVLDKILATGIGTVCPCRTLKLIPLTVLDGYREILGIEAMPKEAREEKHAYHEALKRFAERVKQSCPYPECPHRAAAREAENNND